MNALEDLVEDKGNVIVMGDLNLDGSYDDGMLGDFEDTTVAQSSNAYDRIIINDNLIDDVVDDGIDKSIVSGESDHYLVCVEIEV